LSFSVRPNDPIGFLNTKLLAFYDGLHEFNNLNFPAGDQNRWPEADPTRNGQASQALQAIRAPTLFDALFYTIFPDVGANIDTDYFEGANKARARYPDYMESADFASNNIFGRDIRTPPYFPQGVGSRNKGRGWIQVNANNTRSGPAAYRGYAEESNQPSYHSVASGRNIGFLQNPGRDVQFGFAPPEMIHSGWMPQQEENNSPPKGRIGYSVKLIGFDALLRTIRVQVAGTESRIANPPIGDPNLNRLDH